MIGFCPEITRPHFLSTTSSSPPLRRCDILVHHKRCVGGMSLTGGRIFRVASWTSHRGREEVVDKNQQPNGVFHSFPNRAVDCSLLCFIFCCRSCCFCLLLRFFVSLIERLLFACRRSRSFCVLFVFFSGLLLFLSDFVFRIGLFSFVVCLVCVLVLECFGEIFSLIVDSSSVGCFLFGLFYDRIVSIGLSFAACVAGANPEMSPTANAKRSAPAMSHHCALNLRRFSPK